jgi:hypothetical protein
LIRLSSITRPISGNTSARRDKSTSPRSVK